MVDLNLHSTDDRRVVVFGEVLFDRFPDGSEVLGGAPFNVAWNLQGLGLHPLFVSRVGKDSLGRRVLEAMVDWGMETAAVQVDSHRPTGTVEVSLEDREPAFDIVADRAYDAIDRALLPQENDASVLYHGSLIARDDRSRSALNSLIRRMKPSIFLDVNLRDPWWNRRSVYDLLATAGEVKMNEDELSQLIPGAGRLEDRAQRLLSDYRFTRLYVTRGARGALAFTPDTEPVAVVPRDETRVVDTVGAGDAFSAALILGRLRGWPLVVALERAHEFAAAVVGLRGATTTKPRFYERFATAWREA